MEKYCPKPHPVYFNAFSMWQQLSGSVQYLIKYNTTRLWSSNYQKAGWNEIMKILYSYPHVLILHLQCNERYERR